MTVQCLARAVASVIIGCAMLAAHAQTIYRIVGTDGKITFTDKPPVNPEQGKVQATGLGSAGAALPFELRQVMAKFPVSLYSGPDCSACSSGRALLSARGIPFTELSVTTPDDIAALQRISGEATIPLLTVGAQRIRGYSEAEWTQFLDAAGYPRASLLPAGYRQAAATPLVALQKPDKVDERRADARSEAAPPAGPGPVNPAGIRF